MKKFVTILAAICLVFAVAGNAMADFEYGATSSLVMSIYNDATNVETGYDFGVVIDLNTQNLFLGNVDVSDTNATVALYSCNSNYQSVFGLTVDTEAGGIGNPMQFWNATRDIWNFGYQNGASPVTIEASDPKSASTYFGTTGTYQNVVAGGSPYMQPTLNPLASQDHFDIYLYVYNGNVLDTGFDPATDYAATVRVFANGDVVLNASPVPVPAAVWLLGSGLLGLIGIRRKNA